MIHALGLRNWNSAAPRKLTGRRLSRASVSLRPSIRQPRYSRYAAPTQPSALCSAGQRAKRAQARAHREQLDYESDADTEDVRHRAPEAEVRARGGQHHVIGSRRDRHDEGVGHERQRVDQARKDAAVLERRADTRRRPAAGTVPGAHRYGAHVSSPAMSEPFICDAARTPIGRYGGALAAVRADDLAAVPIAALLR